jgi:predicted phage terminase large subunit-like protein
LYAEVLSDVPGALWRMAWVDDARVDCQVPETLLRIIVAIDPAVSTSEGSNLTGLIVAGIGRNGKAYVLEDSSGKMQAHEWAEKAVELYRRYKADRIVAEKNMGGDLVEATLRTVDPSIPYKGVHASRGKVVRAEPVAALYEQGRVHHVGTFAALEDEMISFTSDFDRGRAGFSPDRVDALVWAITELMLGASTEAVLGHGGGVIYRGDGSGYPDFYNYPGGVSQNPSHAGPVSIRGGMDFSNRGRT